MQQHKLVGILTNRDLRFETNYKEKVSTVMTKENLITAPEGTDLKKAELIFKKNKIEKLPVVNKSGKLIGLVTFSDILKLKSSSQCSKRFIRPVAGRCRRWHYSRYYLTG